MSTFWVQPPHSHHTSNQMMPFSTFNNSMTYPSAVIKGMASCGGSSRSTSSSSSGGHGLRIDSMALYNKANNRNHQSYRQSAAAPPPAVNNNGHNNNLSAGNMYSMRPPLPMMMTTSQRPGSSCSIASNSSADGSVVVAQPPPPLHNRNYQESRYKIEMCRHWEEKGNCPHGHQCLFAHGVHELRPFRGRHRKFKTQLCKAFHSDGFCSFGPRCSYIHSPDEVVATQEGLITVTEMAAKAVNVDVVNATCIDQQQQPSANCMTTSINNSNNDYHMMANTVAVADSISTTIATDLSRLTLSSSSATTTTTSRQLSSSVANSLSSASSSGSSSSTTSGGRLSSPVDDIGGCQSAAVDDLYTRYRLSVFANMCHN
ncbi:protein TIS11-like [Oppia nitens]|uniref:protein TIS11-like n=1 Tax=Oppia nitens TaxID=1686743 RepID=UPI0023DAA318|nr:protein TIS11-like [Oppia nitens]